jgi:DNA repair exonuclease SbcCD ATPase subunit
VEELLQKSLVNEQYLSEQLEWKNQYEQESSKWRIEKMNWTNEKIEMEERLKTLKEVQDKTEQTVRTEIEKYKNIIQKERSIRESLEEEIEELKKTIDELKRTMDLEKEMINMSQIKKNEEQMHQIKEIRKSQRKLEKNFQNLQEKLSSYMHKYNQTLREMGELKGMHLKMVEQLKKSNYDDESSDFDEDTESIYSGNGLEYKEDFSIKNTGASQDNKEAMKKNIPTLGIKYESDIKEYKRKMSSLIKDMNDRGEEISSLRHAFQSLKSKLNSDTMKEPTKKEDSFDPKRASMYNNYEASSNDDRYMQPSDFSDSSNDERDIAKSPKRRSKSADAVERRKCTIKPPVPVQDRSKLKKRKKQTMLTAKPALTQDKSSKAKLVSSSTFRKKKTGM